ncbi:MAG TPA: hypothetical protein VHR97_01820 [Candidatus Baltobacteraceae bacterium]|jgi:hypothetical protein|nr:hypothetical protein [Candidatus Baltobacteraceae bacterium]
MTSSSRLAGLIVVAFATLASALPGRAAPAAMVALNRCNGQVIDESSARVRDYDRHPPANNETALLKRYGSISELIGTLNEEREILDSVCTRDARQEELFAQVAAVSGAALVLQADVTAKLNAACPAAATGVPQMILADAWLGLARVINEQNGTVPRSFADVIPKIQSHAQAINLTLPVWAETSVYWRDQVKVKAKDAVASCQSPSPSPSPT